MSQMEEKPSLLVVLVDISAHHWDKLMANDAKPFKIELNLFLDQLLLFLNSYLLLHRMNELALFCFNAENVSIVYPKRDPIVISGNDSVDLISSMKYMLHQSIKSNNVSNGSNLCAAISMAMCCIYFSLL